MWIEREITALLLEASRTRPVVVLTGARQTGKTSLLKRLFPKHRFVSLDLPSEAAQAENDPESFLQRNPPPLVIDEVQYAPKLFRHLKTEVDKKRSLKGQFILTGSQKFTLMKEISDSLAGRVEILELEPLSWSESRDVSASLYERLWRGGYPELQSDLTLNPTRYYRSYVTTYLERDVRSLLNVSQLIDFERFLRAVALRSGQLLNKAELARDIGISPSTANQWISVLEASNQVTILEPWFSNKTKSMVKSPKIYISEVGLLLYLLGIESVEELLKSPLIGSIWETFVFSELRRLQISQKGSWKLYFWRNRQTEVDFVLQKGGRFSFIECKWTETPSSSDASTLRQVIQAFKPKDVDLAALISRTKNPYPLFESVETVPLPWFWDHRKHL